MTDFAGLTADERRVVKAVGDACSESPDETLASFSDEGKPAVEKGRLVRIRLYRSVTSLDLRGLDALVEVAGVYAGRLSELQLGGNDGLTRLALPRNELRTLDLRGCPALRELDLQANRLTSLSHLPAGLRKLVVGSNPQLSALDLADFGALEELLVFQSGLRSLDLTGLRGLRILGASGNALTAVDLSGLDALESVDLDDTGASVTLPTSARLTSMRAAGCKLEACDATGWPALTALTLPRCGLRTVRLANPRLAQLDLEDNALASIDLTTTPRIARLKLSGNPIANVDLTPLGRLTDATLPKGADVRCTTLQGEVIDALRARRGLVTKKAAAIAKMDAVGLHRFVEDYNWDDGEKKLFEVIRHPACDLGTALLVYWQSQPGEFTAYLDAPDAPKEVRATVELLREIEAKVARGGFGSAGIPFDPRDVGGTDLSGDDEGVPASMRAPVSPPMGAAIVLPGDGKPTPQKAAPKKAAPKKAATKKAATKKAATKKAAPKKAAADKLSSRKAPIKKR